MLKYFLGNFLGQMVNFCKIWKTTIVGGEFLERLSLENFWICPERFWRIRQKFSRNSPDFCRERRASPKIFGEWKCLIIQPSNYDFMLLTFLAKSVFIFESMGFEGFHCRFKIGIRIEPLCVGTQYGIHPAA